MRIKNRYHHLIAGVMLIASCTDPSPGPTEGSQAVVQLTLTTDLPLGFSASPGLAWQDDSTFVVVDKHEHQIVAVRVGGEVWRVGREGDGPGEFRAPSDLRTAPDGAIAIVDVGTMRATRLLSDGTLHRTVLLPYLPVRLLSHSHDSLTAILANPQKGVGPVVGRLSWDTGDFNSWFYIFEQFPDLAVSSGGLSRPSPFVNGVLRRDGTLALGVGARYEFVVTGSDGAEVARIGRPELNPLYATRADSVRYVDALKASGIAAGMRSNAARVVNVAVAEFMSSPKPYFLMHSPGIDEDGRFWLITNRTTGDSTAVDVFESEGFFLSEVLVEGRVLGIAFRRNRVAVLIGRGESGEFDAIRLYDVFVPT